MRFIGQSRCLFLSACLLLASACSEQQPAGSDAVIPASAGPGSREVANRMLDAMGGLDALQPRAPGGGLGLGRLGHTTLKE